MITGIKAENVGPVWPFVADYFQSFSDRTGGRISVQDLLASVLDKKRQMWIAVVY